MVAVLRAETFYLPPPTMAPDAWDAVPAAELALRWTEVHAQRRLPDIPRTTQSEPLNARSEEHTSELQSLMRISYAVFCLKKKKKSNVIHVTLLMLHHAYSLDNTLLRHAHNINS